MQGAQVPEKQAISDCALRPGEFFVRSALKSSMMLFFTFQGLHVRFVTCTRTPAGIAQVACETKKPVKSRSSAKSAAAAHLSGTQPVTQHQPAPLPASSPPRPPQPQPPQQQLGCAATQASAGLHSPGASQDSGTVLRRRPSGISPAGTPVVASPATSEGAEYTLLPGYVSRPGPSPIKAAEQQTFTGRQVGQGQGGFLHAPSRPAASAQHDTGTGASSKQPGPAGGSGAEDLLWMELAQEANLAARLLASGEPAAPSKAGEEDAQANSEQARPSRPKRAAATAPADAGCAPKRARHPSGAKQAHRLLDPAVKFTAGVCPAIF